MAQVEGAFGSYSPGERMPWETGVGLGVLAFAVGYLVSFVDMANAFAAGMVPEAVSGVGKFKLAVYVLLDAHHTGIGALFDNVARNVQFQPGLVLVVTPPVLLFVAGFLMAKGYDVSGPARGASFALTLAAGYGTLAFVLTLFSAIDLGMNVAGSQGVITIPFFSTVFMAAILYPLLFGGLGGLLGGYRT